MATKRLESIVNKVLAYKPKVGAYNILIGQLIFTDYNIRISYRNYLKCIEQMNAHEINGNFQSVGASMEMLTHAKFFFESIYWFMYMLQKVSRQKSDDELLGIIKATFNKYEYLKMPRVQMSKEHFGKLARAESAGDQDTLDALTGDSKFMYEFSVDQSGHVRFQSQEYDPHQYFRDYLEMTKQFDKQLDTLKSDS